MELQTKKKKKHVINFITAFMLGCFFLACSGGGGGDDPEPKPQKPSISLNPSDLTFLSSKGDTKNLEIKTDANWSIVYCPNWLSASSSSGSGNMTISLTTTNDNNSSQDLADQIEIKAISDGQETSQKVSVKRLPGYEANCYARIMENGQLIMSYGMACVVDYGNNTQYFYYKVYTDTEYNNVKGNDSQIVQDAIKSGSGWTRVNIPSSGGVEICYDQCQPKTRYVFVSVSFASNGNHGDIFANDFMTKPKEEEPLATIKPNGQVANEVHDGDTGPWYKWEVKKESGTCSKYYTYACASDTEFDMMKNHKGDFGQYDERDGVKVAWNIWLEHKGDQTTHTTTFNKGNSGGREKLFRSYSEGATQWLTAKTTDKYLQIVTWGVDENNNYSGIVYDVIYKVENGRLYPNPGSGDPDLILDASPTSLQFSAVGGADELKTITINSNTDWTVSSSKDWCEIDRTFGSNSGSITVHVKSNDTSNPRSALITITATSSGKYVEIQVSQDGKKVDTVIGRDDYDDDKNLDGGGTTTYTLSISQTAISTSAAGETKNVNVTSNDSWTVSSNQSWCSISPTSGSNNGTIKVTTSKNTSSNSRSATITIKGTNSGSKTIAVSQDAYTLSVSPSSLQMKSDGESKTVSVSSNDSWTVTSNQSWCTASPSSGSNNGTITIKAASNSSSSRTATLTIKGKNSGRSVTVSVSQEAGTVIGRDEYGNDKEIK